MYGEIAAFLNSAKMGFDQSDNRQGDEIIPYDSKQANASSDGGTTWIELFAAAEIMGVRMDRYDSANKGGNRAMRKASTLQLFIRFVQAMKTVIAYGGEPEQKLFFKPAKGNVARLIGLGFEHPQRGICGTPIWGKDLQAKIAEAILTLRTPVTDKLRRRIDGRYASA